MCINCSTPPQHNWNNYQKLWHETEITTNDIRYTHSAHNNTMRYQNTIFFFLFWFLWIFAYALYRQRSEFDTTAASTTATTTITTTAMRRRWPTVFILLLFFETRDPANKRILMRCRWNTWYYKVLAVLERPCGGFCVSFFVSFLNCTRMGVAAVRLRCMMSYSVVWLCC